MYGVRPFLRCSIINAHCTRLLRSFSFPSHLTWCRNYCYSFGRVHIQMLNTYSKYCELSKHIFVHDWKYFVISVDPASSFQSFLMPLHRAETPKTVRANPVLFHFFHLLYLHCTHFGLVILIASGLNYSYFNWDCCLRCISNKNTVVAHTQAKKTTIQSGDSTAIHLNIYFILWQ